MVSSKLSIKHRNILRNDQAEVHPRAFTIRQILLESTFP